MACLCYRVLLGFSWQPYMASYCSKKQEPEKLREILFSPQFRRHVGKYKMICFFKLKYCINKRNASHTHILSVWSSLLSMRPFQDSGLFLGLNNIDLLNNLKQQISNRNNTLGSRGHFFLIDTDGLPRQQVYFI